MASDYAEVLPTLDNQIKYELEPFKPINEQDSDKEATVSDLALLNNHLAMCDAALSSVKTISGLCLLSATVCKLIETRRKVKKLSFGNSTPSSGRVFEVIE